MAFHLSPPLMDCWPFLLTLHSVKERLIIELCCYCVKAALMSNALVPDSVVVFIHHTELSAVTQERL